MNPNGNPIEEFLKVFSANPNISNDALLKKFPYLKPEKLTRARSYALGYHSGEYDKKELDESFADVIQLFPNADVKVPLLPPGRKSPIAQLPAYEPPRQTVGLTSESQRQLSRQRADNALKGKQLTTMDEQLVRVKDFVTGTTQEQRNKTAKEQIQQKINHDAVSGKVRTQVKPTREVLSNTRFESERKKLKSEKEIQEEAIKRIQDPINTVLLDSEDPIGRVTEAYTEAAKRVERNIQSIFDERLNEAAVNRRVAEITQQHYFSDSKKAENYLVQNGIPAHQLNEEELSLVQPKGLTQTIALEKVKHAKRVNSLLDEYSLEEAALRYSNPSLDNDSYYHYRENPKHNATLGATLHAFLNDPEVIDRAKRDPKVYQQYLLGEQTLHNHYPKYATSIVANKIAQYREDKGLNSWFANDPDEQDIDRQLEEMQKDPDWKLSPHELKTYHQNIRPMLKAGAGSGVIKTTGFIEGLGQGIEEGVGGIVKSLRSTANAVTFDKFKDAGLLESDDQKRKRLVNEQYSVLTVTPKHAATSLASGIGHFTGYMLPMITTSAVGKALGLAQKSSEALSMYLMFEGQNAENAMVAHPDNKVAQVLHTGLATLGDMFLMRLLPSNHLLKDFRQSFSSEVQNVVNQLSSKKITEAAAKESLLNKFGNFLKGTVVNNTKTASVMTAFNAFHQGLDAVFGNAEKDLQDAISENIQAWKTNFLNATLLSAVHAAGTSPKLKASIVREIAENPEKYKEVVNGLEIETQRKTELLQNLQDATGILKDLNERGGLSAEQRDKFLLTELAKKVTERKAKEQTSEILKKETEEQVDKLYRAQEDILSGRDRATEFSSFDNAELPKPRVIRYSSDGMKLVEGEVGKSLPSEQVSENRPQNASEGIVETIAVKEDPVLEVSTRGSDFSTEHNTEIKSAERPVYTTSNGKYMVVYENGKRIVRDMEGVEPGSKTARRYLDEHAETLNYNEGRTVEEKVSAKEVEVPQFSNEKEANRFVVETSENPSEIAEVFLSTPKEPVSLNAKEQAIADYGIGKVKESSYREYGDGNNINNAKARAYMSSEGRTLDVIAKEMTDHTGIEITPQHIVDFIDRFPSGEYQAKKAQENEIQHSARTRFEELTGVPLTEHIANKAILQKADNEIVEHLGRKVDSEPLPEAELKKWLEEEIELIESENNNKFEYGPTENSTADRVPSGTESALGKNTHEQASPVIKEVLQPGRSEEIVAGQRQSIATGSEISDIPLEKNTAQLVAEKLRQWAALIEGDQSSLKSDLLALPKAVVSTLLKGAAEIIEAGGTVKKAFDHVVEKVREYYRDQKAEKEIKEIQAEVQGLFESVGIIGKKPSENIKQIIKESTDSRVKNKVVLNELSALKKQVKDFMRGVKEGLKEGKTAGRIEGVEKGISIGHRQGLQEGYDLAVKEIERRDSLKDSLRGKITNLLNIAVREGLFNGEVKSSVLQAALRRLNAAKTPSQLLDFVEYTGKLLENVEYERDLQKANGLRSGIKSSLKSKEKNADTRAVILEFMDIKPESVEDIRAYNELAEKVLSVSKGVRVSGGFNSVTVKNETFEVDNRTIQEFIDKHWEYREAENKRLLSERYEDLVNMGVIDSSVMSLLEMRELIEAIHGTEDALQKAAEKFASQEAKLDALRKVVEYNHIGLKEYERTNSFSGEEALVMKNLRNIEIEKLESVQLAKLNDVINNIVVNGSFTGAGEMSVIAEVQRDTKVLEARIKASPVKDLGSISNVFLQGFASTNLLQEFIYKSSKVAAEVQRLTGIADIFNGHAKAKIHQDKVVKEYLRLKEKLKAKDDAMNRYRRGVFADVTNHFGGSEADIQVEFNRRKHWIEQTAERLLQSDIKEERREGEIIQRVYEELLESSNNATDVKAKLLKISPSNVELVAFWRQKFAERKAITKESTEIYNNRVWGGVENYTATKLKGVNANGGVKEVGDMFDSIFVNQSITQKVAGAKKQKTRSKDLPKDSVLDLDFDNVQSRAFYETNLDVETTRAILKAKHFLKQPEAVKLFGTSRNRKIIIESLRRSIALHRGTTMPLEAFEKAAYKTVNFLRAKGIRVALGSVFQLFKQYPSVAISALGNLGKDAPLFLKALTISNKLPLFEKFNIGLRGETKAGFNKEVDLGVIDRTELGGTAQKAVHLMEDLGHKLSDIALATLTKSDVSVARTSWLAYYMKDLRRQGVEIEKIDWSKEHLSPNEEAAAYAEQMVSRSQNANDASSMPNFFKEKAGIKGIVTSIILPFSTFSVNQRIRMTNDVQKILFGGEKKEALKSLVATTAEIAAFNAIKIFMIGALTTAGARSVAELFEMWDEDDEKDAENRSQVTINNSISVSEKTKKWLANSLSDFLFSGIGSAPQYGAQQGMNWLYEGAVTETYKDGTENKYPSLFFTKRKGETDWNAWGVLGIPLEQAADAYRSADRLLFGAEHHTKEGVHRDELSENEEKLYTLAFLIDALSVVGVSDAELNNANRKLKAIAEKKMEKRYGGKEFSLTTTGFGKNVEEGKFNFKKLSSVDQVRAWQFMSDDQKKQWADDIHDIETLEEAEKNERNREFFEDHSNKDALEEMKKIRKRTFKRFY